jgi:uncharacterized protein YyaL (SSP411 family)
MKWISKAVQLAGFSMGIFLLIFCSSCQNNSSDMSSPKYTNKLIHETSPYLLQHAHNPVNWYPWGEEALQKAISENKIILVSVGYSACHWCHVMEHESFESEEVAELMNAYFVCIKVDREERPDIDQIYMSAVQLMTGSGGWPLNCFALPDGRPFYGGTYFPKERWMDVLRQIRDEYRKNPDKIEEYAARLTQGIRDSETVIPNSEEMKWNAELLDEAVVRWKAQFDKVEGGPNRAPKFPLPNNYLFLMRYAALGHHQYVDDQVKLTLQKMAFGGIYDQIGGGFTRYSTDTLWKVPHFEKMLYDNGQLISLYSEAYTRYRDPLFREIVYETVEFCQRELYAGNGVFYSALDADSEGEEGKFYVWTDEEFAHVLGDDYSVLREYYNLGGKALWEDEQNIPLRDFTDKEVAESLNLSESQLQEIVVRGKVALLEYRNKRVRPGLDDKCLTSWNALMLQGLVDAYTAFGDEKFLKTALETAQFITKTQRREDGGLNHNYKNGKSTINGYLEDYALSIEALLGLYQATFDEKWLNEAQQLTDYTIAHFYDAQSQMFFFTSDLDPALVARKTELTDNVIPGSNSSMANALFVLGELLDHRDYVEKSKAMLHNIQNQIPSYGSGYSHWGNLMLKLVHPFYEVAICGKDAMQKRHDFTKYYVPNKVLLGSIERSNLPLLEGKFVENQTMYYVCVNKACQMPTSDVTQALIQIR